MRNSKSEYAVSVRLMCYNHEDYIRQAMDGIMMQETDFKVEVVIGDDFSPDDTLKIIKEYESTENIHIKILQREKGDAYWTERQKRGRLYNFQNILENCTGKYIALLDGDDYWIDPQKLQKQYDFLEDHPDCSVCFTAAQFYFEENPDEKKIYRPKKAESEKIYDLKDAIIKAGDFMITATIFFRQKYVDEIPEWVFNSPVGDLPLSLFVGTRGKYGYIDDVTCMYRVNASGSWSQQMNFEKRRKQVVKILKTYDDFNAYTDYKYNKLVQLEKARIHFNDKKSIVKRVIAKTPPGRKIKEWFDL
ncbi:MAG: hypothetical protein CL666_12440 [Balneola sp.]|nr:hypothetical protein [Balneola sp.]|tara:strand:- start:149368 stop:150279 length:912 start_codon:yes stop_codon:yes gene_type:complete